MFPFNKLSKYREYSSNVIVTQSLRRKNGYSTNIQPPEQPYEQTRPVWRIFKCIQDTPLIPGYLDRLQGLIKI